MHAQLELLLEIQDLQGQRSGLAEETLGDLESKTFDIHLDDAMVLLDEKLEELVERLEPDMRARFRRMADRNMRAVAPVLNGICYGCFVALPTATASEAERNQKIDLCYHCGRFLYHVD